MAEFATDIEVATPVVEKGEYLPHPNLSAQHSTCGRLSTMRLSSVDFSWEEIMRWHKNLGDDLWDMVYSQIDHDLDEILRRQQEQADVLWGMVYCRLDEINPF